MNYDIVLCVSSSHKNIALRAIRSVNFFCKPTKIFIITSEINFSFFNINLEKNIPFQLLDENKIIENVNFKIIQDIFKQRIGTDNRAGWYFQQFLKMSICNIPDISDHYLIWDSDTIMLEAISFFDANGRVLVNVKSNIHQPYFDLMDKTLKLKRQVDYTFISEHIMVRTSYMKELIGCFIEITQSGSSWIKTILSAIDDKNLGASSFSEYETYGTFLATNYKDSFKCRTLKSTHGATKLYGKVPNKYDIFGLLQQGYIFATFETWHSTKKRKKKIAWNKFIAKTHYRFCALMNKCTKRRNMAENICP